MLVLCCPSGWWCLWVALLVLVALVALVVDGCRLLRRLGPRAGAQALLSRA
jgi:hypothetical protein